jgi:hypothetical protein
VTTIERFADKQARSAESSAATTEPEPAMRNTVAPYAGNAYEAIRALNHVTYPGRCDLEDPADACTVVGLLESLIYALPQALRQLAEWLMRETAAGRVRVVDGPYRGECDQAVGATCHYLIRAGSGLREAVDCVDRAHNVLADLACAREEL